jgi:hypothetical protein
MLIRDHKAFQPIPINQILYSAEPDDFDRLLWHMATSPFVYGTLSTIAKPRKSRKTQAKEGHILNNSPKLDQG